MDHDFYVRRNCLWKYLNPNFEKIFWTTKHLILPQTIMIWLQNPNFSTGLFLGVFPSLAFKSNRSCWQADRSSVKKQLFPRKEHLHFHVAGDQNLYPMPMGSRFPPYLQYQKHGALWNIFLRLVIMYTQWRLNGRENLFGSYLHFLQHHNVPAGYRYTIQMASIHLQRSLFLEKIRYSMRNRLSIICRIYKR